MAFRIVMLICHYQFHELPRAVKFDTLFHLAEIADQFQVSDLLLPFVRPWLMPYVGHAVESRRYEWILISWTFGLEAVFRGYIQHLVQGARVDDGGGLVTASVEYLHFPGCVAEDILGMFIPNPITKLKNV
jgi:hypothetical protein